jgi:hypothetical protein
MCTPDLTDTYVASQFQPLMDEIAAALIYNELTPEQGYDAFDEDEDGKVSLKDLHAAVNKLKLGLEPSLVTQLFYHLDPEKLGYISFDSWKDTLAYAEVDGILHSRGIWHQV